MTANEDPATKPKTLPGEGKGAKSPYTASEPARSPELLSLTINAETGQIVKLETVDSGGTRRELSEEQKARMAQEKGEDTLEALIEEAFEAGIASVLGGSAQFSPSESEEEEELRHLLLRPLIERSPAKHLMKFDTLTRATLGTLLRHHMGHHARDAESRPSQPSSRGSASKSQQPAASDRQTSNAT
jgi:hypothetical protein